MRPGVKTWAVLLGLMTALLALLAHEALPSWRQWLTAAGGLCLLSLLCTWVLYASDKLE